MEDVVQDLGYLALGTRLKRIGERLQADSQRILKAYQLRTPAGQWPFLAALEKLSALSIGELAKTVGVPSREPLEWSLSSWMRGLVTVLASSEDQRRKKVSLSPQGKRLVATGRQEAWPAIETAVRDLCHGLKGPLLKQLGAIEEGLVERPLDRRVALSSRRRR